MVKVKIITVCAILKNLPLLYIKFGAGAGAALCGGSGTAFVPGSQIMEV
jgi:hypothetical protein